MKTRYYQNWGKIKAEWSTCKRKIRV